MITIEQTTAYLDQVLGNPGVQEDLDRSLRRARQAAGRARRQKSAKAAVSDRGIRHRLQESLAAAHSAALQVKRGPEAERRRRRRKPLLVAGLALSAAAVGALYGDLRDELAGATSASAQQPEGA